MVVGGCGGSHLLLDLGVYICLPSWASTLARPGGRQTRLIYYRSCGSTPDLPDFPPFSGSRRPKPGLILYSPPFLNPSTHTHGRSHSRRLLLENFPASDQPSCLHCRFLGWRVTVSTLEETHHLVSPPPLALTHVCHPAATVLLQNITENT